MVLTGERSMECQFDWAARSDVGRVRENNEDSFRAAPEIGLFVLSDGMGGLASGEVASRIATETIVAHCRVAEANGRPPFAENGASRAANQLADAIRRGNDEIRKAAEKNPRWHGMGATVVAVRLADERVIIAHVGDSRAYRFRSGELEQLTGDHSFVAEQVRHGLLSEREAGESNLQNVLLRALGAEPAVQVDVSEELVMNDDAILLCSDGLTREVSDAAIAAVLGNAEDAREAADQLIDLANQAGGGDNITVIVIRNAAKPARAFARIGRWFRGSKATS